MPALQPSAPVAQFGIVGESAGITEVRRLVQLAADNGGVPVLILGETGTGKELVAQAIHSNSPRKSHTFSALNCAALSEELLESELFGHERGAFTGAQSQTDGYFRAADKGTLFLDDINSTTRRFQAKLLRVLQERRVTRVGGTREDYVDVRLVAASNEDLLELVGEKRFREDLYYRISAFPIRIPPLRSRIGDIPLLAQHLLEKWESSAHRPLKGLTERSCQRLQGYQWPGNVRELENVVQRAIILDEGGSSGGLLELPEDFGVLRSGSTVGTCESDSRNGAGAIADVTLEALLGDRRPLDGFLRGSDETGKLADLLIEGIVQGFGRYLGTEQGQKDRRNHGSRGMLSARMGLAARKAGNERPLLASLRKRLTAVLDEDPRSD